MRAPLNSNAVTHGYVVMVGHHGHTATVVQSDRVLMESPVAAR